MFKTKLRGIISLGLLITFILVLITGIVLFLAPRGWRTHEVGWNLLGLDRHGLRKFHFRSSVFFVSFLVFHFILNFKMFCVEIKSLLKDNDKSCNY